MNSNAAVYPKTHYHIRWLDSGQLDWERHATRAEAEEAAERLSRQNESHSVERFEETCVKCATLVRDAKT